MVAPGCTSRAARPSSTVATKNVLHPSLVSALAIGASPNPYASALMTPAHSARPETSLRRAQLARSAARLIVSTARAESGIGARKRGEPDAALAVVVNPSSRAHRHLGPDRRSG